MTHILLLPGLYDSGPDHWQSLWTRSVPGAVRVVQRDWERPALSEWIETLDRSVAHYGSDVVLVGHSTGAALVPFWAAASKRTVRGALIVAPSDTEAASYPVGPTGWTPMPLAPLPFPSIVVASTDDQFLTLERARTFASAWGSRLENIGAAGHINSASGFGDWPVGRALLYELFPPQILEAGKAAT